MKLRGLSLAAMAAFVFASSALLTATAADPCDACWRTYNKCIEVGSDPGYCEYKVTECLARYGCPAPPF